MEGDARWSAQLHLRRRIWVHRSQIPDWHSLDKPSAVGDLLDAIYKAEELSGCTGRVFVFGHSLGGEHSVITAVTGLLHVTHATWQVSRPACLAHAARAQQRASCSPTLPFSLAGCPPLRCVMGMRTPMQSSSPSASQQTAATQRSLTSGTGARQTSSFGTV